MKCNFCGCGDKDCENKIQTLQNRYAIEITDPITGESKGEYVGIAKNYARIELVKDLKQAIKFGDKEMAEEYRKHIKKSSGGLDCQITIIQKIF